MRAVVAYAIAAFVVIQAADPLVDVLLLPAWTLRLVFALAVLGLPVVIGLAWAFDWGPEGLEPADGAAEAHSGGAHAEQAGAAAVPTSWRIAVIGAVLVLALGGGAWVLWGGDPAGSDPEDRVLVFPLDNATGDPELDAVGRMAADWIIQGLVEADIGLVVPLVEVDDMLRGARGREAGARGRLGAIAEGARADLVVTGTVYRRGDSIEIRGRVLDSDGDAVLDAIPAQAAPRTDPIIAVESLQHAALGILASRLGRALGSDYTLAEVGVRAPSLDAYRLFAEANHHSVAGESQLARRLYLEAAAEDSSWFDPLAEYAAVSARMGDLRTADSMITVVEPHRSSMSRNARLTVDVMKTTMEGNLPAYLELAREHALDVWGENGRLFLASALFANNYPAEAAAVLDEGDANAGFFRNYVHFVVIHTGALHYSGQHRRELGVAQNGRALYPDLPIARFWEARALATLDRPAEARAALEEAMTLPPGRRGSPGWAQMLVGLELRRHGHEQADEEALRRGLEWYRAGDRESDYRYSIARGHLWLGELDRALPLLRELSDEGLPDLGQARYAAPDRADRLRVTGWLSVGLARAGRVDDAQAMDARLADWDDPYVNGQHLLWRAAIAAELGDLARAVAVLRDAIAEGVFYSDLHEAEELRALWDYGPFQELIEPRG